MSASAAGVDGTPQARGRVAVAMSGGVDSSVAAALLLEQGHQVFGVTLRLRRCDETGARGSCCGGDAIGRARAVAGQLGIPHYVLDCADAFERLVLRPAWDDYAAGRTPSPCLLCNEQIKFGALLRWARRLDAAALATGHYARIATLPDSALALLRGADPARDQSYFLAGLEAAQLRTILFPLGHLDKAAVRALGRARGLASADTRDSQDACLGGPAEPFADALRRRFGARAVPGAVVDAAGRELGRHAGLHRFTVGQRRGLGVASPRRHWVLALRAHDASVVVTDAEHALLARGCVVTGVRWLAPWAGEQERRCQVQVRSRHTAEPATVERRDDDAIYVRFARPVRAVAPGQAAVFYDGARVLGRGWIHAAG